MLSRVNTHWGFDEGGRRMTAVEVSIVYILYSRAEVEEAQALI